ncbi:MAG: porin [Pirellulales bacterium]
MRVQFWRKTGERWSGWTKRLFLVLIAFLALTGLGPDAVVADETALRELQSRVEALEQQNAELRQTILQRLPDTVGTDTVGTDDGFVNANAANLDTPLHSLFEAYLAEQEAKKAAEAEAAGHEVGSDLSMTASWRNGLELTTKNKDFRVHVGGRTQIDTGWFSADPNLYSNAAGFYTPTPGLGNVYADGVDFRRARFRIDGKMYEQIEWAAEYDFMNSAVINGVCRTVTAPTDLWWAFNDIPFFGQIKIGNQKEGIGFEHMVSSRFLPFMERSYNQDAFYGGLFNGFNPGIAALGSYGEDDIGTYNVGIFKPTNNVFGFNTGDGDYALTGRFTRLLVWEDEGLVLAQAGYYAWILVAVPPASVRYTDEFL